MTRKSITSALLVVVVFAFSHLLQASPLHKRPPVGRHPGSRHGPAAPGRFDDCGSCGPGGPGGSCGPMGGPGGAKCDPRQCQGGPGGPGGPQRCPAGGPGGQCDPRQCQGGSGGMGGPGGRCERCSGPGGPGGPQRCPAGGPGGKCDPRSCPGGPGAQRCDPRQCQGGAAGQKCDPRQCHQGAQRCPPNAKCSPEMCGPDGMPHLGGPAGRRPRPQGPGRRHRQHRSAEATAEVPVFTSTVSNTTLGGENVTLANTTAIDTLGPAYYGDGTTAMRVKRQGGGCGCCGCCCCRPCCCCCCPCCCCCQPCCCCCCPCCCCCRCCCCCCRPCCCCCCQPCCCCCCRPCCCCCCPCCCCCCRPCCCCCCPCCCGCGCCGCGGGGGRRRRAIADLSHKLMDQQAEILKATAKIIAEATNTTVAPSTTEMPTTLQTTTVRVITNTDIYNFGRSNTSSSYGSLAVRVGDNFNLTLSLVPKN